MYHLLVIYDADNGALITAVLRPGNKHASYGVVMILRRIIQKLKRAFPGVELIIRGDAGLAVPELYEYCEQENLGYVIRNDVLEREIQELLDSAKSRYEKTQKKQKLFGERSIRRAVGQSTGGL